VARGIGREGFGNARDLRNAFETAAKQAKARDDFDPRKPSISMQDVIGPEPTPETMEGLCAALGDLNSMEGLEGIKEEVAKLVRVNKQNYQREVRGDKIQHVKKNRLFWGNPGTGKSTVAAIYGRILKELRMLSNGEVVLKTASDFIGSAVGESVNKTTALLELCKGKVLVIDEAYNLDDNLYGKQVLDTIVEKVNGEASEDIAIIMAGYKKEMEKMLREQNPGLASRFSPDTAFEFMDYADSSLKRIFTRKCRREGIVALPHVVSAAIKRLARKRDLPRFGNAREVDSLVSSAIAKASSRELSNGCLELQLEDVMAESDKEEEQDPLAKLRRMCKMDAIIGELEQMKHRLTVDRQEGGRGGDKHPDSYLFLGNGGTGKTTVARVMASVLQRLGVLLLDKVHETTASELKGAFVGHAQKHVKEAMEEARGGVLFIDEAYDFASNQFGKEALAAICDAMTKPEYAKTVLIMAGYPENMRCVIASLV
jgi:AAA+ superfamily predicted ATPase